MLRDFIIAHSLLMCKSPFRFMTIFYVLRVGYFCSDRVPGTNRVVCSKSNIVNKLPIRNAVIVQAKFGVCEKRLVSQPIIREYD